jgi:hypothetical protein
MKESRDNKVNENVLIVKDTEDLVIKMIQEAKTKMIRIKLNVGVFKFKDGPHLQISIQKLSDFQFP